MSENNAREAGRYLSESEVASVVETVANFGAALASIVPRDEHDVPIAAVVCALDGSALAAEVERQFAAQGVEARLTVTGGYAVWEVGLAQAPRAAELVAEIQDSAD